MRRLMILLFLLTLILSSACGEKTTLEIQDGHDVNEQANPTPLPSPRPIRLPGTPLTQRIPATVKRVIDGDTILVTLKGGKEERVLVLCVDTEESVHPDKSKNTELGKKTAGFVRHLLPEGTKVILECEGRNRTGKHDRRSQVRFVGPLKGGHRIGEVPLTLGHYLIAEGYSPYSTKYGRSKRYHEQFEFAERVARKNRLGIWKTEESTERYLKLKDYWNDVAARAKEEVEFNRLFERNGRASSKEDTEFHRRECKKAKSIKKANWWRYISRDLAIEAGKKPCEVCKP